MRHDVVSLLEGSENVGIELGVAEGIYSKRMIDSGKFARFYGVDVYGDSHDTKEYCKALQYVGFQNPDYTLLRMDFDSALGLFEDCYFDFIYVDGFAHTGEEGGKTLIDWIEKLKIGGILAGDDYHKDWPLVKWAVNDLVKQLGCKLYVTSGKEAVAYSQYPTWFIIKSEIKSELKVNKDLFQVALKERNRIHRARVGYRRKVFRVFGVILRSVGLKDPVKKIVDYFLSFR
jgi:hypothetical protein